METPPSNGEASPDERDEDFRLLFEHNPLPMWVYDLDSLAFLDVNAAAIAGYGYTREEFLGMRITDMRPVEDVPALLDDVRRRRPTLQQRTPSRHTRKDGTVIDVEVTSHTLSFLDKDAALVVALDVTEQKRAQAERLMLLAQEREAREAAVESRQRLEFLYRTMGMLLADGLDYPNSLRRLAEAVVPTLADWCALHVIREDGAVERLAVVHADLSETALVTARQQDSIEPGAKAGPGRVLRTGEAELYPEVPGHLLAELAEDEEQLHRLRSLGLTSGLVVPLVARGQTLGVLTMATAQSGRRYGPEDLALAEDLAHRAGLVIDAARLHEATQRANAALEQRVAERTAQLEAANQELESFSYSVSHDLRSPLRAIEGFTRILVESHGGELSPKAGDYLQRVRRNALRMGTLIDDLLQFSRLSRKELQKRVVRPAKLVRQVLEELGPIPEEREVQVEVGDLPSCQADPVMLKQVYVNLLSNALKFSQYKSPAVVRVGAECRGGEVVFTVSDNGAGFDMRYADKLFGVFQRLHRAEEYEGTGVGLAIVQRIIHRHGGEVWAKSAPGEGATFFFTLPAASPAPPPPEPVAP